MRKILFAIAVLIAFLPVFAQEEKTANDFLKEGKEAYKAKDYGTAYEAFYQAIVINKRNNEVDTALFYNTGYCAYKSRNYAEAGKLFDTAIRLNYKKEKAYLFAANSFKKAQNSEELDRILEAGLAEYPNNAKLKKLQSIEVYKKGLQYYNEASKTIQGAATLVESDPERYKTEKAEADKHYKQAMPYLEKAYDLNPNLDNLKEALIGTYEGLGMQDKADKMRKK
jgi:tetratricopeptide (TPR) repeat protein